MQNAKTRLGQASGPFCFPVSPAEGNAPSWETVMTVNVYLSDREALWACCNGEMHAVDIDDGIMSQAERDYLAQALKSGSDGVSYVTGPTEAHVMALLVWLRGEMAEVAKETAIAAKEKKVNTSTRR